MVFGTVARGWLNNLEDYGDIFRSRTFFRGL